MIEKHNKEWGTDDEIDFILRVPAPHLKKLMPVLRKRDRGNLDGKKIMAFAERRYAREGAVSKS